MFQRRRFLVLAGLVLGVASSVLAQPFAPRQYYSDWKRPAKGNYAFRNYYFKPTPNYAGYRVHEVRYFPTRPRHLYFFNPKTQKYWGRCHSENNGTALYSLLKTEDRHKDLQMIPESAFPSPAGLPPIPDSDPAEGATLDLPPEDAPSFLIP